MYLYKRHQVALHRFLTVPLDTSASSITHLTKRHERHVNCIDHLERWTCVSMISFENFNDIVREAANLHHNSVAGTAIASRSALAVFRSHT
jgi:hypothetical protein